MMPTKQDKSDCCNANVKVMGKTTKWFACTNCSAPCDLMGTGITESKDITIEELDKADPGWRERSEPVSGMHCVGCSDPYGHNGFEPTQDNNKEIREILTNWASGEFPDMDVIAELRGAMLKSYEEAKSKAMIGSILEAVARFGMNTVTEQPGRKLHPAEATASLLQLITGARGETAPMPSSPEHLRSETVKPTTHTPDLD